MVRGRIVRLLRGNFESRVDQYKEAFDNLSSTWQGVSSKAIINKSKEIDKVAHKLSKALSCFAQACDDYHDYDEKKKDKIKLEKKLEAKQSALNAAKNSDSKYVDALKGAISGYNSRISDLDGKMNILKHSIQENLSRAQTHLCEFDESKSTSQNADSKVDEDTSNAMEEPMNPKGLCSLEIGGKDAWVLDGYNDVRNVLYNVFGYQEGSQDCAVYATAAGWALLGDVRVSKDSKASSSEMYKQYNDDHGAYMYWPGMSSENYPDDQLRRQKIIDELDKGKPVVIRVKGSSDAHYVTAIGYRQDTDKSNVQPEDILIYDSAPSDGKSFVHWYGDDNTSYIGFDYSDQLVFYPDKEE